MAANPREVARNLFRYANGNPSRIREIRKAFDEAMAGALTKGGMDNITNATKNGVGMTKFVGLNEEQRQAALGMAIDWLDAGFVPSSSRSFARF